jgi:glycosyltransferase involved in cell wall biosynthesis
MRRKLWTQWPFEILRQICLKFKRLNIIQITPGAGGMYCGNCFRDNALVAEWRRIGHSALMLPLYLPMNLEEADQSAGVPIFFSGINVYLEQKFRWFSKLPNWVHQALSSPSLLSLAAGHAAKTKPSDVGDLALSMLEGEQGNQASELEPLIAWLRDHQKPEVICLSNGLLSGLARRLKSELNVPVVCMLQGEDSFLDALSPKFRERSWETFATRAAEMDALVAPSRYYAELMTKRLHLPAGSIQVVYNGVDPEGYTQAKPTVPTLGYFARMCPDKGLDTLVEAFILLKKRNSIPEVRMHIGGGLGPSDEAFVQTLKNRLQNAGVLQQCSFFPNLDKNAKQDFYRQLSVMSVPALYGEAFGLYLLEAWASGVPVVQPDHAAFPELIKESGAGLIYEPKNSGALAENLERILRDPALHNRMSDAGIRAVQTTFHVKTCARNFLEVIKADRSKRPARVA